MTCPSKYFQHLSERLLTHSSHVIDVFTAQPQPQSSKQRITPRIPCMRSVSNSAVVDLEPPVSPVPHLKSKSSMDLSQEDMRLMTIKKGRGGAVYSPLRRGTDGWKAVQEAIG
jgi:hypothetical protein